MSIVEWSPDAIEYLRQNFGKLSARQIANTMPGVRLYTRNAVVGKAARLGLTSTLTGGGWGGKGVVRERKPKGSLPAPRRVALARTSVAEMAAGAPRFKQVELTEPVVMDLPNLWCKPVDLIELDDTKCRWPLDGGKFCGLLPWKDNPYGASPYCVAHHQLGHRAPSEHRRLGVRR